MEAQMTAQAVDVARIEHVDRATKVGVLDPLVLRQIQIAAVWIYEVRSKSGPACESMLAGDSDLRIAQRELRGTDVGIGGFTKARMEFPDPLACVECASCVRSQQIFCLVLEMIEVRTRR